MQNDKEKMINFLSVITGIPANELSRSVDEIDNTLNPMSDDKENSFKSKINFQNRINKIEDLIDEIEKRKIIKAKANNNNNNNNELKENLNNYSLLISTSEAINYIKGMNGIPEKYKNIIINNKLKSILLETSESAEDIFNKKVHVVANNLIEEDKKKEKKNIFISLNNSNDNNKKFNAIRELFNGKLVTNKELKNIGYFFLNKDGNFYFHSTKEDIDTKVDFNSINSDEYFLIEEQ